MTAKEYLQRLQTMSKRIDAKIEEKERLMAQATRATTVLSAMPRGGGKQQQGFERFMDRVADMEADIVSEIDALVDEKQNTLAMIALLAEPAHREVLKYRYIDLMNLDRAAMMMPCSRATTWRLEKSAMEALDAVMEYYGILRRMKQNNGV